MNAYPYRSQDADRLLSTHLFSACSPRDWEVIRRFTSHRTLKSQEVLFWQNDACHAFYYLIDGCIKLCRRNQQAERVVNFVEGGEIFAESAVFAGEGYPYSAVALEDSELIAIQAYPFVRFAQSHPTLPARLISHMSRCLHRQYREREHLVMQSAAQKVAAYLLDRCNGSNAAEIVCRLPKRRIDLANLLSMTPETLSRTLKRFKDIRWIQGDGCNITVAEPSRLRELLN